MKISFLEDELQNVIQKNNEILNNATHLLSISDILTDNLNDNFKLYENLDKEINSKVRSNIETNKNFIKYTKYFAFFNAIFLVILFFNINLGLNEITIQLLISIFIEIFLLIIIFHEYLAIQNIDFNSVYSTMYSEKKYLNKFNDTLKSFKELVTRLQNNVLEGLIWLRKELEFETTRRIINGRIIASTYPVQSKINYEKLLALDELSDQCSIGDMITNRINLLATETNLPTDELKFYYGLYQNDQKLFTETWNVIVANTNTFEDVFNKLNAANVINYSIEQLKYYQIVLKRQQNVNLNVLLNALRKTETIFDELNRIKVFLETEDISALIDAEKVFNGIDLSNISNKHTISTQIIHFSNIDQKIVEGLTIIYIDRFYRLQADIMIENEDTFRFIYNWVYQKENNPDIKLNTIVSMWNNNVNTISDRKVFDEFKKGLEKGKLLKTTQEIFKFGIEEREWFSPLLLPKELGFNMKNVLSAILVEKVQTSLILRLFRKNKLMLFVINFKAGDNAKVQESLDKILSNLEESFSYHFKQWTTSSRIGIIKQEFFEKFCKELDKRLHKGIPEDKDFELISENASVILYIQNPNDIGLEFGKLESKKIISELMSERLQEEEMVSTLIYQDVEFGFDDFLNESTLKILSPDKVWETLSDKQQKSLDNIKTRNDLLEELKIENFYSLISRMIYEENEIRVELLKFFKRRFKGVEEAIVAGMFEKVKWLRDLQPKHKFYQKIIWKLINPIKTLENILIKEEIIKSTDKLRNIVSGLISYQETISNYDYEKTQEFKHETTDLHPHFNAFFRSLFGGDNVRHETEALDRKRCDFEIFNIPIEVKLVLNDNEFKRQIEKAETQIMDYEGQRNINIGFITYMDLRDTEQVYDDADNYSIKVKDKKKDTELFPLIIITVRISGLKKQSIEQQMHN